MDLGDFSSMLQLAATLNIAFVAVEYAKGYTHTLLDEVFRFPERVEIAFKRLLDRLPDKETLDGLPLKLSMGNPQMFW